MFDLSDVVFNTLFLESNSRLSFLDDLEEIDDIQVLGSVSRTFFSLLPPQHVLLTPGGGGAADLTPWGGSSDLTQKMPVS